MEKLDQHPSSGLHHRQPGNKQGKTQSMNPGLTELEPQHLKTFNIVFFTICKWILEFLQ